MTRDINKPDLQPVTEIKMCKAQVDRDAAPFLLFETVRINAGERPHQGGLAVVDVTCCSDDDVFHRGLLGTVFTRKALFQLVFGARLLLVMALGFSTSGPSQTLASSQFPARLCRTMS